MSPGKLLIRVAVATVMLIVGGCREVSGPNSNFFGEDCQETSEFANYGCIDIQGTVTNSRGQPLTNIDIAPVNPSAAGLGSDFVFTGDDGTYELRLLQVSQANGPITLTLKATSRRSDGSEITNATQTVSVVVTPLGETPEPVTVNFTLPVN